MLQQKNVLLQTKYTTAVQRHQQIIAEEQQRFCAQAEIMQTNFRDHNNVATMAGQRLRQFRNTISEIQQDAVAKFRMFQQELEDYKTQINQLATHTQVTPDCIKELAKLEAFDLWVQKNSAAEEQISA